MQRLNINLKSTKHDHSVNVHNDWMTRSHAPSVFSSCTLMTLILKASDGKKIFMDAKTNKWNNNFLVPVVWRNLTLMFFPDAYFCPELSVPIIGYLYLSFGHWLVITEQSPDLSIALHSSCQKSEFLSYFSYNIHCEIWCISWESQYKIIKTGKTMDQFTRMDTKRPNWEYSSNLQVL